MKEREKKRLKKMKISKRQLQKMKYTCDVNIRWRRKKGNIWIYVSIYYRNAIKRSPNYNS